MPLRAEPRRVSVFVHDLSENAVVRAAPLAAALADDFEVEMLGLLPSGRELYPPYRDRFEFRHVDTGASLGAVMAAGRRLAALATGHLMLSCKPLFTTLWPAVLATRERRGRGLLLDVEDDELSPGAVASGPLITRLGDARRRLHARLAHPLTRRADAVTVSTRKLQRRYGGVIVRHGPDEREFDPCRAELQDREALRRRFRLPGSQRLALFAGVPRPHKGWATLLDALDRPGMEGWTLVGAGVPGRPEFEAAATRLGPRFHFAGMVANADMPALLAACDAVPVPQRPSPFAEGQLPAKALEAMAMRVPVVGTRVGDLPEILGEGERGWLIPPEDPAALAAALIDTERDAARRTAAARRWFLAEASRAAMRETLLRVVDAVLSARAAA